MYSAPVPSPDLHSRPRTQVSRQVPKSGHSQSESCETRTLPRENSFPREPRAAKWKTLLLQLAVATVQHRSLLHYAHFGVAPGLCRLMPITGMRRKANPSRSGPVAIKLSTLRAAPRISTGAALTQGYAYFAEIPSESHLRYGGRRGRNGPDRCIRRQRQHR